MLSITSAHSWATESKTHHKKTDNLLGQVLIKELPYNYCLLFWYCCSFTRWIKTNLLAWFKVDTVLHWHAHIDTETTCASSLNNLFNHDLKLLVGISDYSSVFSLLQVLLDNMLSPASRSECAKNKCTQHGHRHTNGGRYICHFNNVGSGHENGRWSLGPKPALAMHHAHLAPGTRWQRKTHSWLQKQKKSPSVECHFPLSVFIPQFLELGWVFLTYIYKDFLNSNLWWLVILMIREFKHTLHFAFFDYIISHYKDKWDEGCMESWNLIVRHR